MAGWARQMLIGLLTGSPGPVKSGIPTEKSSSQGCYMKRQFATCCGFTLVELMITVVIIGIVAGMAVPRFGKLVDRLKMRGGVRHLTSELRLARSMAIADKDQYGLQFNNANKTITLFRDRVLPATYNLDGGDSVIHVDTLPPEFIWVWTDCANQVLAFKANGSAGFSGGGNIWTMGLTHDAVCISWNNVLASTGRVQSSASYY
jgi:prepilin-type N-terminal cleavage/methylation domain-containing protein